MSTITVTNLNDNGAGSDFASNLAGGTLVLTSGELDITSKNLTIDGDINGTPAITREQCFAGVLLQRLNHCRARRACNHQRVCPGRRRRRNPGKDPSRSPTAVWPTTAARS
jgi:hypothetical protein